MSTPALVLIPPPTSPDGGVVILRSLEETLKSLMDCEGTVPPELEAEYYADVQRAIFASRTQRDQFQSWLVKREQEIAAYLGQAAVLNGEIQRLNAHVKHVEQVVGKAKDFAIRTIQGLAEPDAKGKYPARLEGTTVTLGVQKNGGVRPIQITDDRELPAQYRKVTVTLPLQVWEETTDSLDLELRSKVIEAAGKVRQEADDSLIRKDLTAEPAILVPGATLADPTYRLTRK